VRPEREQHAQAVSDDEQHRQTHAQFLGEIPCPPPSRPGDRRGINSAISGQEEASLARTPPRALRHAESGEAEEASWPIGLALATSPGVTVLVALVSEIFVESVQKAAEAFG